MSRVFAPMNKVIVDDSAKGVVPYFQLPSMLRNSQAGQPSAPQSAQPLQRRSKPSWPRPAEATHEPRGASWLAASSRSS